MLAGHGLSQARIQEQLLQQVQFKGMLTQLKVLLVDLETSPNLAFVWGKYEQDVIAYQKESYLLSFAYKWFGQKGVHAYSLPDFPLYKKDTENDFQLVSKLHQLMNEADIIVAHNGDNFDIKRSNASFITHGLQPPPPHKTIDTLKLARKYFAFNSNKLNDLCDHLSLGEKVKTGGFDLWKGCLEGDMKAWRKMIRYNKHDVELLEKLYKKILPWMDNERSHKFLTSDGCCPNCGSKEVKRKGYYLSSKANYEKYQCESCGRWIRGVKLKRG